jgi:hypothetical protein
MVVIPDDGGDGGSVRGVAAAVPVGGDPGRAKVPAASGGGEGG